MYFRDGIEIQRSFVKMPEYEYDVNFDKEQGNMGKFIYRMKLVLHVNDAEFFVFQMLWFIWSDYFVWSIGLHLHTTFLLSHSLIVIYKYYVYSQSCCADFLCLKYIYNYSQLTIMN